MKPFVGNERMRGGFLNAVQVGPAFVQGRRIAKHIPRLQEAGGPNRGLVDVDRNGHAVFRLLVIGDSNVAGTGAPTHEVALTGQLAVDISAHRHVPVAWEAVGSRGATMEHIRTEELGLVKEHDPDMVILVAGANDAMTGRSLTHWEQDLRAVLAVFVDRSRGREILVAGVPPFRYFPALRAPLNEFLDRRAGLLDEVTAAVCTELGVVFVSFAEAPPLGEAFFAADRFHPSVAGYGHWARFLLNALQRHRDGTG